MNMKRRRSLSKSLERRADAWGRGRKGGTGGEVRGGMAGREGGKEEGDVPQGGRGFARGWET